jgi:glycosyltransferase involved in cell wall biosynthesis
MDSVNVIMPTFNRPDQAINVIKSFRNQTFEQFKFIIVDDGSKEANYTKLKNFVDNFTDLKIILIRCPQNGGIPVALNKGLQHCDLKYTTWISDDNEYMNNFLQVLVTAIHGKQYAYAAHTVINKVEGFKRLTAKKYKNALDIITTFSGIAAFMWDTQFMLSNIGLYNEHINGVEDFDYQIRTFLKATKIGFARVSLINFIRTTDSLFYKKRNMIAKKRMYLTKLYKMYLELKGLKFSHMYVSKNMNMVNVLNGINKNNNNIIIATCDHNNCVFDKSSNVWFINFDYYQSIESVTGCKAINLDCASLGKPAPLGS